MTGAGQGIGKGVARALAKEGAAIAVLDLDGENAGSTAREIAQLGAKSLGLACDIRDRNQVNRAAGNVVSEFGTVDILANVAQAWGRFVPLQEKTSQEMALGYESGPLGTWHLMVACYPFLKDKNGYNGKIINFGSGAGFNNMPFHGEYSAAKEAIRALTRTAAVEWGENRINTNVICPAAMTPGWKPGNVMRLPSSRQWSPGSLCVDWAILRRTSGEWLYSCQVRIRITSPVVPSWLMVVTICCID